jgi:tryptophanyl-tRNA synthetase
VRHTQINSYAFSGGGATVEEHRAKGANLDVDVPWKYLNFFMEDDDKLATIGREYGAGRMLTGAWVCVGQTATRAMTSAER